MRGENETHGVVEDVGAHRHLQGQVVHLQEGLAAGYHVGGRLHGRHGLAHDGGQLAAHRVGDEQLVKEAVELGLGQRVGALHLDRVLRGQHVKRARQRARGAGNGHRLLLHRF